MQIEPKDLTPQNLAGGVMRQFQTMYGEKTKISYEEVLAWLSRAVLAAGPNGHLYVTEHDVRTYLGGLATGEDGQKNMKEEFNGDDEPRQLRVM